MGRPQVVSTLKVNINREKEARLKKILGIKKEGGSEKDFFDPTLKVQQRFERQKRKTFRFIDEGALVQREQRLVKKMQEKVLGVDKKEEKKKKEAEPEPVIKKIEPKIMRREPIPDVEW